MPHAHGPGSTAEPVVEVARAPNSQPMPSGSQPEQPPLPLPASLVVICLPQGGGILREGRRRAGREAVRELSGPSPGRLAELAGLVVGLISLPCGLPASLVVICLPLGGGILREGRRRAGREAVRELPGRPSGRLALLAGLAGLISLPCRYLPPLSSSASAWVEAFCGRGGALREGRRCDRLDQRGARHRRRVAEGRRFGGCPGVLRVGWRCFAVLAGLISLPCCCLPPLPLSAAPWVEASCGNGGALPEGRRFGSCPAVLRVAWRCRPGRPDQPPVPLPASLAVICLPLGGGILREGRRLAGGEAVRELPGRPPGRLVLLAVLAGLISLPCWCLPPLPLSASPWAEASCGKGGVVREGRRFERCQAVLRAAWTLSVLPQFRPSSAARTASVTRLDAPSRSISAVTWCFTEDADR